MNTLKVLSLSTLLGALLVSGPVISEESPETRIFGAFTQQAGITFPADLRHQAAQTESVPSEHPSVERVYGVFYRDAHDVVKPISGDNSPTRTTADEHRQSATYTPQGDELLFGSFVRIDGIAMPASVNRRTDNYRRDQSTGNVATRQDR